MESKKKSPPPVASSSTSTAVASPSSSKASAAPASAVASAITVASSVPAAASAASGLVGQLLNLRWDLLVGFSQDLHEVPGQLGLVAREERVSNTFSSRPASTPDAVDVVLDGSREGKVDDDTNVLDVCRKKREEWCQSKHGLLSTYRIPRPPS